jgi:hypothetical protein
VLLVKLLRLCARQHRGRRRDNDHDVSNHGAGGAGSDKGADLGSGSDPQHDRAVNGDGGGESDGGVEYDVFMCRRTRLQLVSVRTVEYLVAATWNCSFCSKNCATLRDAAATEALAQVGEMHGIPKRLTRLCTRISDKITSNS